MCAAQNPSIELSLNGEVQETLGQRQSDSLTHQQRCEIHAWLQGCRDTESFTCSPAKCWIHSTAYWMTVLTQNTLCMRAHVYGRDISVSVVSVFIESYQLLSGSGRGQRPWSTKHWCDNHAPACVQIFSLPSSSQLCQLNFGNWFNNSVWLIRGWWQDLQALFSQKHVDKHAIRSSQVRTYMGFWKWLRHILYSSRKSSRRYQGD